jgi:GTP cyclohydrolase I
VNVPVIARSPRLATHADADEPTTASAHAADDSELECLVRRMLEIIGEEPDRAGLVDTPRRVAKALRWLTSGYSRDTEDAIGTGIFEEPHDSMVLVKDIEFYSLCEHHMLPFYGRAHVAYIPDGRIIGLSKLARIVDVFARKLQVQERLTDQIADALCRSLRPKGVAVVIESAHLCMMMRGVEKQNSKTLTSAMRGAFADCPMTREEFLHLALRSG